MSNKKSVKELKIIASQIRIDIVKNIISTVNKVISRK